MKKILSGTLSRSYSLSRTLVRSYSSSRTLSRSYSSSRKLSRSYSLSRILSRSYRYKYLRDVVLVLSGVLSSASLDIRLSGVRTTLGDCSIFRDTFLTGEDVATLSSAMVHGTRLELSSPEPVSWSGGAT